MSACPVRDGESGGSRKTKLQRIILPFLPAAVMLVSLFALASSSLITEELAAQDLPGEWQILAPSSTNRQEVSYVQSGGRFYLAGGSTLHERYDPATDSWKTIKPLPTKLDHIQGVELDGKIYYIGGLAGWPKPHASSVYIYDPATDTFSNGTPMPASRSRGAGGVAVHDGKIYYAGGLHNGTAVAWFDVYDPAADTWAQLPDMPRVRDHFQAAVVDGKFYAIAGRDTLVNATTTKVDVYDLASGAGGTWQTPNTLLPTARGGFATAVLGKEILVIGGEGGSKTYNTVEAYNTATNSWRKLEPMPTARHGIQAAVCNGGVYIAAGGKTQGGSNPTNVHEAFFLNGPTTCDSSPGDTTLPETTIVSGSSGTVKRRSATFTFSSSEPNSTFECSLDDAPFSSCTSPKHYTKLKRKRHHFLVRATDAAGNTDPIPASRTWKVRARR